MKILIIGSYSHSTIGGAEKYISEIILIAKKMGFEIQELFFNDSKTEIGDLICPSKLVTTYLSKFTKKNIFLKVIDYKIKMHGVNRFLEKNHFDLIIVNTSTFSIKKKYFEKCMFIQHEDIQLYKKINESFIYKFFNLCSIALTAKYIVCNSDKSVSEFKKLNNDASCEFLKIPLYIKTAEPITRNPKNIVFLGRFCKEKGAQQLDKLAPLLKNPIHLYGNGPYKFKNTTNIINHGYVKEHEIHKVFENAKLNISLSKSEGMGFSVLEGFSYGVPCLIMDSSTNSEFLVNRGKNGVLCNKNFNLKQIADIINNLDLSNFDSCEIRSFCERNFNYHDFEKNWEDILLRFSHSL